MAGTWVASGFCTMSWRLSVHGFGCAARTAGSVSTGPGCCTCMAALKFSNEVNARRASFGLPSIAVLSPKASLITLNAAPVWLSFSCRSFSPVSGENMTLSRGGGVMATGERSIEAFSSSTGVLADPEGKGLAPQPRGLGQPSCAARQRSSNSRL